MKTIRDYINLIESAQNPVAEDQTTRTCPTCDGSGEDALDPTKSCRRCGGKGYIPFPKEQGVAEAEGVSDNITDNDMAKAAYQDGVKIGRGSVGNNMDHYKKVWGEHFKYFNQGFLKGRNANAKTLKAFGQGDGKNEGVAERARIRADKKKQQDK